MSTKFIKLVNGKTVRFEVPALKRADGKAQRGKVAPRRFEISVTDNDYPALLESLQKGFKVPDDEAVYTYAENPELGRAPAYKANPPVWSANFFVGTDLYTCIVQNGVAPVFDEVSPAPEAQSAPEDAQS